MKQVTFLITLLTLSTALRAQGVAVINTPDTPVYASPSDTSAVLRTLSKGQEITYTHSESGWLTIVDGYIQGKEVISRAMYMTLTGTASLPQVIAIKSPNDYTQEELLYLLIQEEKKNEVLRKDVKVIKGIAIGYATITAASILYLFFGSQLLICG